MSDWRRTLWVVEMQQAKGWLPTVGAHLTRQDARVDLKQWRVDNKIDVFRIRRYTPRDF